MAESNILVQVKNIVSKTLKISLEKLDVDADFDNFGVDSIIAMELMSNLSKEMDISITPAQFTEVNSIKELADSIEKLKETENKDEIKVSSIQTSQKQKTVKKTLDIPVQSSSRQRPGTRPSRNSTRIGIQEPYKKVLDKVHQEFSIDLRYRKFLSIEEIADTLVTGHLNELLSYYKILEETIDVHKFNQNDTRSALGADEISETHLTDIAIVGMSCNFPDAPDPDSYWNNLIAKKNSIREIPESRWNWKNYYSKDTVDGKTNSKWAALIEDHDRFDAKFFQIDGEEAVLMDPQERLLLQEVYKSFQDGGINPAELKGSNTGVFVSYEYSEYEHYLRNNIDQLELSKNKPFFSSSSPTYYLANRLSFLYDFNGPSESFNVNCAGSAVAINRAYHSLLNEENDMAVVGGVSLNLFAEDYIALSKYGMLSPDGTCAVFDDKANGFTRGEGVASVVLKRLADAEKDNNKIYGVIKSSNQNNRGKARFMQEIDTESITDVISHCYEKAAIEPAKINYIEVDGYATKWGDSFEYEGVKKVFGEVGAKEKSCALGSLKGNIGNLESVNGLASLIKMALSMHHKKFPATISKKETNTFIDIENPSHPLYLAESVIPFDTIRQDKNHLIRAGINAFADTGVNVHILLEEYGEKKNSKTAEIPSEPQLFLLSAKDTNRLMESVQDHIDYLSNSDDTSFTNIVYTSQLGREAMEERLAIITSSGQDLVRKLSIVKNNLDQKRKGLEKEGIFIGSVTEASENPLNGIFTDDMAQMLVAQTKQQNRWQKLAKLWIIGFDIPWRLVWENMPVRPVSLPLYPFYKDRYWAEIVGDGKPSLNLNGKEPKATKVSTVSKKATTMEAQWFFYRSEDKSYDESSLSSIEKIELFLQQQIALLRKKSIHEIDPKKSFLDIGLNSIDIGTFVSNTMNLLNITLSPAILFNNADIESLARYLKETYPKKLASLSVTNDKKKAANEKSRAGSRSSIIETEDLSSTDNVLVPLQTKGKKRPIFAVSQGGNGTTLSFQNLVQALGGNQPFYGLEFVISAYAIDQDITIEKIAKTNVEAIRKVQKKGPYLLVAYSNGGMIAFEMAKILMAQGERIESLYFLDCFSPLQPTIDMADEMVGAFNAKFINTTSKGPTVDLTEFKNIPEKNRLAYLYKAITKNGFTIPRKQFETTYKVLIAMERACRAYKPSRLAGKLNVQLFRATKNYLEGYEKLTADYGWNKLLSNKLKITPVEADHFSITDKESSGVIAKKITMPIKKKPIKKVKMAP